MTELETRELLEQVQRFYSRRPWRPTVALAAFFALAIVFGALIVK